MEALDHMVVWASTAPLVKGCVISAVLVALWCGSSEEKLESRRTDVFVTLVAALTALFVARVLALSLPFRPRPLHNPEFAFALPFGLNPELLDGWSAFPSDHAVLYFAVAAGVWRSSRRAGIFLFAHAAIVISLPRLYLGLHHPSDIVAGALIGIVIIGVFQRTFVRERLTHVRRIWQARWPFAFYVFGWYFLFELSFMFLDLRKFLKSLLLTVQA